MRNHALLGLAAGTALAAASACSSISDSVTSPSRWLADSSEAIADSSGAVADSSNASSRSSGSGDSEERSESSYRDDVRVAARAFAESGGDAEAFLRQLGRIAEDHGISHWEGQPGTFIALGAGLREAGVPESELGNVLGRLRRASDQERAWLDAGYRSAAL